jgi:hypothetical protein
MPAAFSICLAKYFNTSRLSEKASDIFSQSPDGKEELVEGTDESQSYLTYGWLFYLLMSDTFLIYLTKYFNRSRLLGKVSDICKIYPLKVISDLIIRRPTPIFEMGKNQHKL